MKENINKRLNYDQTTHIIVTLCNEADEPMFGWSTSTSAMRMCICCMIMWKHPWSIQNRHSWLKGKSNSMLTFVEVDELTHDCAIMDGNNESPSKRPRRAVRECIFCATSIDKGVANSIDPDVVMKCLAMYSTLSPAMSDTAKCDGEGGTRCLEFAKQCDSFQETRLKQIHSESTYHGHSKCFERFSFVLSTCKHCSSIERQKRATNCTKEQCCPVEMSGSSSHRCTLCGHRKQVSRRKRGFQHQRGQFVTKPINYCIGQRRCIWEADGGYAIFGRHFTDKCCRNRKDSTRSLQKVQGTCRQLFPHTQWMGWQLRRSWSQRVDKASGMYLLW